MEGSARWQDILEHGGQIQGTHQQFRKRQTRSESAK